MTQTDRRPHGRIPITFASPALRALAPAWRTTILSLSEMSAAAFFIGGTMFGGVGDPAPWFVLAVVLAGLLVRTAEIESWALFIPGGLVGRVKDAFGRPAALTAAAAVLAERLFFVALAATVAAHYVVTFGVTVLGRVRLEGPSTADGLATWLAIALVGGLWIRARIAHSHGAGAAVRWIAAPFVVLLAVAIWGIVSLLLQPAALPPIAPPTPSLPWLAEWAPPASAADWMTKAPAALALIISCLGGLGHALPAIGAAEALTRAASDLPQPRLHALRRIARLAGACALIVTAGSAFAFAGLVPDAVKATWVHAPLAGVADQLIAPAWLRPIVIAAIVAAAALMLGQAAHAGLRDTIGTLQRLAKHGAIAPGFRVQHPRFGTPARVADAVAAAIILILLASGGRISWLAHAYAVGVVWTQSFRIVALRRLRTRRASAGVTGGAAAGTHAASGSASAELPADLIGAVAGPRWTFVLALLAVLLALSGLALLALGEPATWAGTGALIGLAIVLTISARRVESITDADEAESFELLPSTGLSLDQIEARPGSVLVAVRHPYSLAHLTAALQAAGDRDVVVMTARLHGHDAEEDQVGGGAHPTAPERLLFSQALAIAERDKKPIRLLIVPAHDVFDALIAAILRLRASEVYVGESSSLSADAQARLLGEAWERAAKSEPLNVRLVIRHGSGRVASYFLGAHAPTLTAPDLDLIHQVWLDAVKAVGPHVHHHDVVRAALLQLSAQLDGPRRDEAVAAIAKVARPADELSAIVRQRDFSQLRDVMRNRHASDIAALLTDLSIEDQVVAFRLLPRKDAAATFEYLSHDTQESLLKAMAQEDVATLLNNMAPDDRTMFLEELPATVTRQMLALLTPEERSVAVKLLGYPEDSIGRLMTPSYIAVREHWTVRDVLDFVRANGRKSETLNVIYVVDEQGLLIDDIRIRDFLLNPPDARVAALMDRRFVALKATDSEDAAVTAFRQYDRVALPVTDTAGMLIGIVTIDDVLDVAEAATTKEIQRMGGSEALDEPYMRIAFGRMVRKRAGWLTALFLGEMLTATAMGAFEQEISKLVVLALFVPLIISSGGNSGSQASTLVIRALALGEVTLADWWRVMKREVSAGLALGAILGLIGFLRITIWSAFSTIYGEHWLLVAFTVGLSLVGVVLWGTVVGSLLPLLLRRLGFDPATSSAPFVATLVDVTGLIIYFSVALLILRVPLG